MATTRPYSNATVRSSPIWATGLIVLGGLLAALSGGFCLALGFQQAGLLP